MNAHDLNFANYWRNTLADNALGKGAPTEKDVRAFYQIPLNETELGKASEDVVSDCFHGESPDKQSVDVAFYPFVYRLRTQHGHASKAGFSSILVPVRSLATLDRNGRIYPIANKTTIARDILEPIDGNTYTIGQLSSLDKALSKRTIPGVEASQEGGLQPSPFRSFGETTLKTVIFC